MNSYELGSFGLRLYGNESLSSRGTQSLLARRAKHFRYTAQTCVNFKPSNYKQMAGLALYYDTNCYHYIYITAENAQRCISTMTVVDERLTQPIRNILIDDNSPITLRAEVNYQELTFYYSCDGEKFIKLPYSFDYSVLSDDARKGEHYTGSFCGIRCQDLSGTHLPADFSYFEYIPR